MVIDGRQKEISFGVRLMGSQGRFEVCIVSSKSSKNNEFDEENRTVAHGEFSRVENSKYNNTSAKSLCLENQRGPSQKRSRESFYHSMRARGF